MRTITTVLPLSVLIAGCGLFLPDPIDFDVDFLDDEMKGRAPASVSFDVALGDDGVPVSIALDADEYGPLLELAPEHVHVDVDVDTFAVQGDGSMRVLVDVVSVDGLWTSGLDPIRPQACELVVGADTDPLDHAAAFTQCLREAVADNGQPRQIGLELSAVPFRDGAIVEYSASYTMSTEEEVEIGCELDTVMDADVLGHADQLDFTDLQLGGVGVAFQAGLDLRARATVYWGDGVPAASAAMHQYIAAQTAYTLESEVHVDDERMEQVSFQGNVAVDYFGSNVTEFTATTVEALIGAHPDDPGPGMVDACWVAIHDSAPNSGLVVWGMTGLAEVRPFGGKD